MPVRTMPQIMHEAVLLELVSWIHGPTCAFDVCVGMLPWTHLDPGLPLHALRIPELLVQLLILHQGARQPVTQLGQVLCVSLYRTIPHHLLQPLSVASALRPPWTRYQMLSTDSAEEIKTATIVPNVPYSVGSSTAPSASLATGAAGRSGTGPVRHRLFREAICPVSLPGAYCHRAHIPAKALFQVVTRSNHLTVLHYNIFIGLIT
jgi:hypothetical protein